MAETIKREPKTTAAKTEKTVKTTAAKTEKVVKTATAKTAKKAAEAVEAKTEEVKVEKTATEKKVKAAVKNENATGLRIGAVVLWVLALAMEVVAILVLIEKIEIAIPVDPWVKLVFFLVLDLIFLIIGSQLWKKANHKDPASSKNKLKFWLWNNMGLIVAAFCFIPFIILTLSDKKADQKTKTIATIAAVVALVIGGLASYDWNPMSQETKNAAETILAGQDIYWTNSGKRYHLDENCAALSRSSEIMKGTIDEAISSYGKDYLCKFCLANHTDADGNTDIDNLASLVQGAE